MRDPTRVRPQGGGAQSLRGIWTAAALIVRQTRVLLLLWCVGVPAIATAAAVSVGGLYPPGPQRQAYAQVTEGLPAAHALNGPARGLDSHGGIFVFEAGWYLALAVAVMAITTMGYSTRGQEQSGRLELLRARRFGRHADLGAAVLVTAAVAVVIAVAAAVGVGLAAGDLRGGMAYGAALLGTGLFFAALTAVAAQLTEHARGTYTIAGFALAASFALRAIGDGTATGAISWLSPLGWSQGIHPFAENRPWPLLLSLSAAAVLLAVAVAVEERRDLGSGVFGARAGRTGAVPGAQRPWRLAVRLARGTTLGWGATAAGLGVAFGAVTVEMGQVAQSSRAVLDLIGGFGGADVLSSFLAMAALISALLAAGATLAVALAPARDEQAGRADLILARRMGRSRWLAGHAGAAATTGLLVLVAGGTGIGAAHAFRTGDAGQLWRCAVATIAHLPALLTFLGVALLLYGWFPRRTTWVWLGYAVTAVIALLGRTLRLPGAALDLSPFEHSPRLFETDPSAWGAVFCVVVAIAAAMSGFLGFRRRDLV
ncbi:hypothetical protein IU433_27930 [Nocardia puris]|uniref:ABC transporter permease n=1 Tax=Nocardia puris TaxID=208602 RepID=UPI000DE99A0C|nr:hypothetical protein [Nocardia puris]MBF6214396.1 hypothetical protein [Nocardia puris]MBF6369011.1 hypothetical protein [Nocardia puris]MBF6462841.1 hypothetical protein [Nocardia puris]